ncbi:MAG: urea ABC transporter ATP-binding subunit UrtE [Candidatus Poribacteria bacterium]|nr:urea ABC transporter ATP-binding subunit UrtE [Candidatus Poribacteria bacterium]MDE0503862.1 urea ABC transporter ATP-binding subunit UrtE [Candidatus Poribacteria bacterium]
MLNVQNLSFSYGEVQLLRGIDVHVPAETVVSVMGRNGVGKTTLMNNIIGLLKPSSGSIQIEDRELVGVSTHRRIRAGLGYVPQGRMIFPKLTVEENLRVGLSARGDKMTQIPDDIYELFPILKEMGKRMGGDLSGGQQQQLAIGRALVTDPKVLILDEPTEGIQPNIIQQIGAVLRKLVETQRMTILIVEQYLDFVREFCQQFYIMNRGEIVAHGETDSLGQAMIQEYLSV